MTTGVSRLWPARLVCTFALSEMVDADGIKTSIGTSTSAQEYTGAALDGALMALGSWRLPRGVSVTTSVAVGRYNTTDPIVFTGTDWEGHTATASVYLTDEDGGETVSCGPKQGLLKPTKIEVPEQLLTGGAFEFGVRDIVLDHVDGSNYQPIVGRQVRHGSSTSAIRLGLSGDDAPADPLVLSPYRDTVPGENGERHDAFFIRIYGPGTTADPVTIYI